MSCFDRPTTQKHKKIQFSINQDKRKAAHSNIWEVKPSNVCIFFVKNLLKQVINAISVDQLLA